MEQQLRINTLGGLSIYLDNKPVTGFVSRKVDALLVYLAANPREHPRELLGEMLWDDLSQSRTMSYLRTTLSSLQKQLAPFLLVSRQTIAINPDSNVWLDIKVLDDALEQAEQKWDERKGYSKVVANVLEEALALYKGNFMEGFNIRNARGFEGWMILEQERLHNHVLEAFYRLGAYNLGRGNLGAGIDLTAHALKLDPLWEKAHRQMMLLLLQSGQRAAALAQYETCRNLLDEELGIEPEDETIELYEKIQAGELTINVEEDIPNNLPVPPTPFVDRPDDIEQISQQLDLIDCRMLTLIGPGGIGKSRLALEVARRHLADFQQGVYFINFVTGQQQDVVDTIANNFDLRERHDRDPVDEVIQHLRDKEILLVLDNFDSMIDSADILCRILEGAPFIKFLITARERLNVQEEWLYIVEPMHVPRKAGTGKLGISLETYPAIQMFIQSAKRMRMDFEAQQDLGSVVEICQLVEGVPLAIELAASWIRMMQPAQIKTEIEHGLDILSTSLRNVPERHRSMRAVFESSWNQLSPQEQRVFRRLSIFRGGFDQKAAETVCDASIFTLSALVDKSLLVPTDGRYTMHELLRQYGEEKLEASMQEYEEIADRHSGYFSDFMDYHNYQMSYNRSHSTFFEVITNMANIWAGWDHALAKANAERISTYLMPLYRVHDLQSRYRDGEHAFRRAADILAKSHPGSLTEARAKLLLGVCLHHLTQFDEAQALVEDVLPMIQENDGFWDIVLALRCLGNIAYSRGQYLAARDYFQQVHARLENSEFLATHATIFFRLSDIEAVLGNYAAARDILAQSREIIEESGGRINLMRYYITLGDVEFKIGDYDASHAHFNHALNISEEIDMPTSTAVAYVSVGRSAYALGNFDESISACKKSIEICDEIRNLWGKAFALMHLGRALAASNHYAAAKKHYRESLEICQDINSQWIESVTLRFRGEANFRLGDIASALDDLANAYQIAQKIQAEPVILDIMSSLAGIAFETKHKDVAFTLATTIANHAVSEYEAQSRALDILSKLDRPGTASTDTSIADVMDQALQELTTG